MGKSIYDANRDEEETQIDESVVLTIRDARFINWGALPNLNTNSLMNMDLKGSEIGLQINLPNPGNSGNKPKGLSIYCQDYNSTNAIEVSRYHNSAFQKQFVVTNFGEVYCKLLWVKADQTNWPDYVFDNRYNLPSLSEVEKQLINDRHLAGIQSSKEVETNGLNIFENLKGQTKNIEELYLHLIALEKRVKELELENNRLKIGRK